MSRNTSVSLGDYFENFVDRTIAEGRFKNVSEVIRAGLRLLEEDENTILALKQAVKEGMSSGLVADFDPKKFLEELKERKISDGEGSDYEEGEK